MNPLDFLHSSEESGVEDMVLKEEEIGGTEDEDVVDIEMQARDADMEAAEGKPE